MSPVHPSLCKGPPPTAKSSFHAKKKTRQLGSIRALTFRSAPVNRPHPRFSKRSTELCQLKHNRRAGQEPQQAVRTDGAVFSPHPRNDRRAVQSARAKKLEQGNTQSHGLSSAALRLASPTATSATLSTAHKAQETRRRRHRRRGSQERGRWGAAGRGTQRGNLADWGVTWGRVWGSKFGGAPGSSQ